MKQVVLALICLLALACGAAQEDDASNDGESDIGQSEQAQVTASCLTTQFLKYGVDTRPMQPSIAQCQISSPSAQCKFADKKLGFELGFTTGWTTAQRQVWDQLGPSFRQFFGTNFSAWVNEGGNNISEFRVSAYGFDVVNTNYPDGAGELHFDGGSGLWLSELQQDPNLVEVQNGTRPTPSWWANRATTATAHMSDLAGMACVATRTVAETYPAQVSLCTKWLVHMDYVKAVDWANQRGFGKANILNGILKNVIAIASGLGQTAFGASAFGVSDQILDPSVNPTGLSVAQIGWINTYQSDTNFNPAFVCVN